VLFLCESLLSPSFIRNIHLPSSSLHSLIPETKGRSLEDMDVIFGSVSAEQGSDVAKATKGLEHETAAAHIKNANETVGRAIRSGIKSKLLSLSSGFSVFSCRQLALYHVPSSLITVALSIITKISLLAVYSNDLSKLIIQQELESIMHTIKEYKSCRMFFSMSRCEKVMGRSHPQSRTRAASPNYVMVNNQLLTHITSC
jgi:hypothetical protein